MFRFVLTLAALIAAHPLQKKPYNAIKFVRVNGNGIALYTVKGDVREMGAKLALKAAFERSGAHCFHCEKWIEPQKLSYQCTRDHLHRRPKSEGALGGNDRLHNLVFACSDCNHAKGRAHLMTFNVATGIVYQLGLSIGTGGTCRTVHRRHPPRPSAQAAIASSSRTGASASRNWRALASQVNVWPYAAHSPRSSVSALVIA